MRECGEPAYLLAVDWDVDKVVNPADRSPSVNLPCAPALSVQGVRHGSDDTVSLAGNSKPQGTEHVVVGVAEGCALLVNEEAFASCGGGGAAAAVARARVCVCVCVCMRACVCVWCVCVCVCVRARVRAVIKNVSICDPPVDYN